MKIYHVWGQSWELAKDKNNNLKYSEHTSEGNVPENFQIGHIKD